MSHKWPSGRYDRKTREICYPRNKRALKAIPPEEYENFKAGDWAIKGTGKFAHLLLQCEKGLVLACRPKYKSYSRYRVEAHRRRRHRTDRYSDLIVPESKLTKPTEDVVHCQVCQAYYDAIYGELEELKNERADKNDVDQGS